LPSRSNPRARVVALYLPQFHPIPENDEWWGRGFTEWTNMAKAKPLFRGHCQPNVPADLGFYDLRLPEAREAQAALAREYGVKAFCYYHYWFAGRRILERPFNEVVASRKPDLPFCLCWANETWSGIWHGNPGRVLIEQTYPGRKDYERHFAALLPAFSDSRHLRVDGKPVFLVYRPTELPNGREFADCWRELAAKAGLPGIYLVAQHRDPNWDPASIGFDAAMLARLPIKRRMWVPWSEPVRKIHNKIQDLRGVPTVYPYSRIIDSLVTPPVAGIESYPCVIPNWDNTPRSGKDGLVLQGSTPELFRRHLRAALDRVQGNPPERRIVFVKSWNEWAEGNYLEPDLRYGKAYLDVLREEVERRDLATDKHRQELSHR